ncbi:MAG: hypothetical protein ACFKPT_24215 [Gloeotrichia echinulata GP01]
MIRVTVLDKNSKHIAFVVSHDESICCSKLAGDFCEAEKVKSIINKN